MVKQMQLKELITEAIEITGLKTEEEVIELGLKTLIQFKKQQKNQCLSLKDASQAMIKFYQEGSDLTEFTDSCTEDFYEYKDYA